MCIRPILDVVEVATFVDSVEVGKWAEKSFGPVRSDHTDVGVTHEHLAKHVDAVCYDIC